MKLAVALALGLALASANAQAEDDESLPWVQAALHGGYRVGGSLEDVETGDSRDLDESSSFAVAVELRYGRGDDRFYQLWYSRQSTDVSDGVNTFDTDVEYLHIGGTLPFGGWEHAQPYFAAGLGVTRFSASDPAADDRVKFSGSMALGLEVPLGKRTALRFEGRGYLTFTDTNSAFFCKSDNGEGVCRIVATGSSMFQGEALAGILVRF
jgi:hypothetical protein